MKKISAIIIACTLSLLVTSTAHARDVQHFFSIEEALKTPIKEGKLDGSVKFYFGKQRHPKVLQNLGSDIANRKTNAFGKSDVKSCNWAFLSALVAMEERAHQLGANAVINVVSYYQKNTMSSMTDYECHAGGFVTGVALKGDFVRIARK